MHRTAQRAMRGQAGMFRRVTRRSGSYTMRFVPVLIVPEQARRCFRATIEQLCVSTLIVENRRGLAMPIRILLVDDFAGWRQTVCSMLAMKPRLQVVGEASDGAEAVQKAVELKPDLILLDIGLPTLNGIQAARQIRKLVPESKIIFLSQESSPEIIEEAMNVGASGYVVKMMAGTELLTAVESVLLGGTFVSRN